MREGLEGAAVLGVEGTRFTLDGKPFPFTGISFFNAIYNRAFNQSRGARLEWMRKFQSYGINVLRIWGQWDSRRGFVDTEDGATLYRPDGSLNADHLARLKEICSDAQSLGMAIELAMFAQESWHDGVRLAPEAADRASRTLTEELRPHRNVALQIWNEFAERALEIARIIKSVDPERMLTNSSGVAGVLLAPPARGELEQMLDFLTPHTVRQQRETTRHWEVAPLEIDYLIRRFNKPVVDDEPARNGTTQFGGPDTETSPYDHILQIHAVWRCGGYIVYHHDMFQTGYGSPAIPPSGIPDPEFDPYHREVLEFVRMRERYQDRH